MKRMLRHLRPIAASLHLAAVLLALLLAYPAAANFCNNATPPCSTSDPKSGCYTPPKDTPKCEPCGKCTRSPCYVGSGAYESPAHDLSITTTGAPIDVTRLYQSTHSIDGESGYGWVSSLSARLYYSVFLKAAPSTYEKEVNVRLTNGKLYRFVENANGTFTPPEGRFDNLVHNGDGTWDLWLQRSASRFHFAANGNLLSIVDDYGNTQTWTYSGDRVSRITDSSGSGRYVDITHGADGRISDVTDMTGRNVHYTYNTSGMLTSVTNALGQSTSYSYVNGKYVPLLSAVTDHWGRNITTITYDAQNRVTTYTEDGETYSYTYAAGGNSGTTSKADSSGNTWLYPFVSGGLVGDDQPPGGGPAGHTDYLPNGLPLLETDATGVKTHYTYNASGDPLTITKDYQGPTAVQWRFVYDTNFPDQPLSVKPYDPATNLIHAGWQGVQFDYYPSGSPAPGAVHHIYRLDNDGTTARLVSTFTYDTHGRVLTETDAGGNVSTATYDASGNMITVETPANNDANTTLVTTYAYDALGRMISVTDPLGKVTSTTWDVLDRVQTVTLPKPFALSTLNFVTTYHYDEYETATGLLFTRVVDHSGRATRVGTNQYGQTIRNIDPAGNISRNVFTKGLLSSIIDANGNTTSYAWDARRRLSTVTHPDGTYEQITYHADNSIATRRSRTNQIVTFTYDRHKRVATKSYPNGGTITSTYAGQNLTQVVDTFASPSETHTFAYDSAFRRTATTQASRGTVSFTYTTDGRVATMSVASGATTTYGYYPSGDIRSIAWSPVAGNFKYDYTLTGRLQNITFPNGQTRAYTHDDQGRVVQIANVHPSTGTLASFTYGHDVDPFTGQATQLDMRTSIVATVPALGLASAVTNFAYDNRYFLNRADYPAGAPYNGAAASWTYDAAGNRASATLNGVTSTYVYNHFNSNPLNSAQLQSDGGNSYTYDAKGNVTARTGTRGNFTFNWDYENRLRAVNGDITAGYLYDYAGRRTLKTVSGASTTYLYADDEIVAESGATSAEYVYGPGLDQPLAMLRNGQIYYYAIDGNDSVVTINDAAGAVVSSYAWDAWGAAVAKNETVVNPYGYTAREFSEAGLQHSRFRSYEAAAGRFLSEDPLQEYLPIVGSELYGYVRNAPLNYTDPYGLRCSTSTKRGPWYRVGNSEWSERWVLATTREIPYVPRIPFLKSGPPGRFRGGRIPRPWPGTRYYCYWNRYFVSLSHYQRDVVVSRHCDCPWQNDSYGYSEHKTGEYVKFLENTMTTTVNQPCSFSPPG